MSSEAWADLGGGRRPGVTVRRRVSDKAAHRAHGPHTFDPQSGWCGCGLRDTGEAAEGSPAWREALATR